MTRNKRTLGATSDEFARLVGTGDAQDAKMHEASTSTSPISGQQELFVAEGEPFCTLLLFHDDTVYVAVANAKAHHACLASIRNGVAPSIALPADHRRVRVDQVVNLKHEKGSSAIRLSFLESEADEREVACNFANGSQASYVVSRLVSLLGLKPRSVSEKASVRDITIVPAYLTAVPLLMLLGCFLVSLFADVDDIDGPRKGALLQILTRELGPIGLLSLMALVALLGFAFWLYRFLNRPLIDVYHR